ncbi:MAG TPA: DUF1761 domain-containing protein [Candidatus Paceibacterota bacterium]|nr:DUF1761 domain-containing protein [Candidatus Paceibacterota bacterium]
MTVTLNGLAILGSMVLSVIIGFVWYGPLFGKRWMALSGIIMPPDKKPCFKDMLKPILISLIGAFFMALCLSYSIAYAGAFMERFGTSMGIQAGFWSWLGFVVPIQLSFVAWEGKPWKLFCIHAGYWLVLLCGMGIILSL